MSRIEVLDEGAVLSLMTEDAQRLRFHAIWLRDNAWDAQTRSPSNGQRLIALRDIPAATRIGSAQLDGDKVQICFSRKTSR